MPSLPATLPHSVEQLVEELDQLNPAPTVTGADLDCDLCKELIFQAGRRSVVEELVRLLEKARA